MNKIVTMWLTDSLLAEEERSIIEKRGKTLGFDMRGKDEKEIKKFIGHIVEVLKEASNGKI